MVRGASRRKTEKEKAEPAHIRLSDVAYQKILEGLFNGDIPAGSFVSQNDLVERLGIAVQPLRDALKVLEAEGVVTVHPRSGIEFLKPDLELTRSTYQFRTIIERAAARRYAETGSLDEFRKMIEAHDALVAEIRDGKFDEVTIGKIEELEEQLHGSMVASLDNPLVLTTAHRLQNYVRLIQLERLQTPPLALKTLEEHLAILRAIEVRDGEGAEAAVSAHFQAALQRFLGMF